MEVAAIMAIALANGDGKPPDWPDLIGIVSLLFINSTICFIEENNAGNAAAALMAGLAPKTKVYFVCSFIHVCLLLVWSFFSRFHQLHGSLCRC